MKSKELSKDFSTLLLNWFEQYGRKDLPWQVNPTPYRVWLSEIMLQQTQVKTVIPYYLQFTSNFPEIDKLAQAPIDEVLHLWTGLGYYARARNLHKTAQIIVDQLHGEFPDNMEDMTNLPGIGRSTAGAIMSLGMGKSTPILDGNCKRVYCRYAVVDGISSSTKVQKKLWTIAEDLTPIEKTSKYNQAIMDLGATLCLRSNPKCNICPVEPICLAKKNNTVHLYPEKKITKKIPQKSAIFLILRNPNNEVLLQQRPPAGIWGGLWCFPQYEKKEHMLNWLEDNTHQFKIVKDWPEQTHTFSHYKLAYTPIEVMMIEEQHKIAENQQNLWYKTEKSLQLGFATPIKNILKQLNV